MDQKIWWSFLESWSDVCNIYIYIFIMKGWRQLFFVEFIVFVEGMCCLVARNKNPPKNKTETKQSQYFHKFQFSSYYNIYISRKKSRKCKKTPTKNLFQISFLISFCFILFFFFCWRRRWTASFNHFCCFSVFPFHANVSCCFRNKT